MLSLLVFAIGLLIPSLLGWLIVRLAEGRTALLRHTERLAWATVWGPTAMAALTLVAHWAGMPLTVTTFLIVAGAGIVIAGGACVYGCGLLPHGTGYVRAPANAWPLRARIGLALLCLWTAVKLIAGAIDLVGVPTFWDDSFNNWNMRGKMYLLLGRIELAMPIDSQTVQEKTGVGSYPPTLPLLKTWMAGLRGEWVEGMINGMHIVWLLAILAMFAHALRRFFGHEASAFGTCLLASLPLLLIHGANPYADVWLSSHVFICGFCILQAARDDAASVRRWLLMLGIGTGLLLWTKNEATVLYLPMLIAGTATLALMRMRSGTPRLSWLAAMTGLTAVIAAPWLLFKMLNGLTYGNAKSVTDVAGTITYQPASLQAISYHFVKESNWLLLPLIFPLTVLLSGRRALRLPYLPLLVLLCGVLLAQGFVYTFTRLSTEAIRQTGLSRGIIHIVPLIMLVTLLMGSELLARNDETDEKLRIEN